MHTDIILLASGRPKNEVPQLIRSIDVGFVRSVCGTGHATRAAEHSDAMNTQVREACGAGMHRVGGACVATPARRSPQVRGWSDLPAGAVAGAPEVTW